MVSSAYNSVHGSARTIGGDGLQRRATKRAKALQALNARSKELLGVDRALLSPLPTLWHRRTHATEGRR